MAEADDPILLARREARDEEARWIDEARRGDPDAFGRLVKRHQRTVTRLAVRFLGDLDEADGAAQDAFVRAWEKLDDFRGDCPFGAWVCRIAANLCRDRIRRSRLILPESRLDRREESGRESDGPLASAVDERPDPERSLLSREIGRKVAEMASELPDMQRDVFALRYYDERPLAEIAALFGVEVGTIKTHLFRATHRIRKSLEVLYGNRFPV